MVPDCLVGRCGMEAAGQSSDSSDQRSQIGLNLHHQHEEFQPRMPAVKMPSGLASDGVREPNGYSYSAV